MKEIKIRKSIFVIAICLSFAAGALLCFSFMQFSGSSSYSKLEEIEKIIDEKYYRDADSEKMMEGAYHGLVEGLNDPYSSYFSDKEYEKWKTDVTGEFDGIGVLFSADKDNNFKVVTVYRGTPADKAGLKAGDYILSADGKTYRDLDRMAAAIRGKAGTKVKLVIYRDKKTREITIERAEIKIPTVASKILPDNIGYIKVDSFEKNTYSDFKKDLTEMERKKVKGLVIDLRNNGGGLVTGALSMLDDLVGEGVVLYVEDGNGHSESYEASGKKTSLAYVILVNGATASASEIVSAAVKDHDAGEIVGTKTFGKGVIQDVEELSDGSAVKLTTMQYFSPDHHKIHKKGVKPDHIVKNAKGEDRQLEKAVELLK